MIRDKCLQFVSSELQIPLLQVNEVVNKPQIITLEFIQNTVQLDKFIQHGAVLLEKKVISYKYKDNSINLSNKNIFKISPSNFPDYLLDLDLSNNMLDMLDFKDYPKTIRSLNLSGNQNTYIFNLKSLVNLEILIVTNIGLTATQFNDIYGELPSSLKTIDASDNNWDKIPENIKKLPYLSVFLHYGSTFDDNKEEDKEVKNEDSEIEEYLEYDDAHFDDKMEKYYELRELATEVLKGKEFTDDLKLIFAKYYKEFPGLLYRLKEQEPDLYESIKDFKDMLDTKCINVELYHSENNQIKIYVDENKKIWCYDEEEWDKVKSSTGGVRYNPFTLKGVNRKFEKGEIKRKSIKLKEDSRLNISIWIDLIYTFGLIYYKISEEIAQDFARTLSEDTEYELYRGMSFKDEKSYAEFLHKSKVDEGGNSMATIKFDTFSSWSYNIGVAHKFANSFPAGIVIFKKFKSHELVVDITKIKNIISNEEEVIALPFKGQVKIIEIF